MRGFDDRQRVVGNEACGNFFPDHPYKYVVGNTECRVALG